MLLRFIDAVETLAKRTPSKPPVICQYARFDPELMVEVLKDEQAITIAAVLSSMPADISANILLAFPSARRSEIVRLVATSTRVDELVLRDMEETIRTTMTARLAQHNVRLHTDDRDQPTTNGIERLQEMLNAADPDVRTQLVATLEQSDVGEESSLHRSA